MKMPYSITVPPEQCCNHPKLSTIKYSNASKNAEGIANSSELDQTAPRGRSSSSLLNEILGLLCNLV